MCFSSRGRHTRYWRDWSSDVCSSGLSGGADVPQVAANGPEARVQLHLRDKHELPRGLARLEVAVGLGRLRERVGATDANLKGVVADPGQYALGEIGRAHV